MCIMEKTATFYLNSQLNNFNTMGWDDGISRVHEYLSSSSLIKTGFAFPDLRTLEAICHHRCAIHFRSTGEDTLVIFQIYLGEIGHSFKDPKTVDN